MKLRVTLFTFAIICFSNAPTQTPEAAPLQVTATPKRTPVTVQWKYDLKPLVGEKPLGLVVGTGRETEGLPRSSISFIGNDTIGVTFLVRSGKARLSPRDQAPTNDAPLYLRGIFIGATDGKLKASLDWPTDSRYASIIATQVDGNFITERGSSITLYSADLKELRTERLPTIEASGWQAHVSRTGLNLLFIPAGLYGAVVPWIWMDGTTLQFTKSWKDVHSGWVGISDTEIAMTKCVWVYDCEPSVEVRSLGSDWRIVENLDRRNRPRPKFVDESTIFLLGNQIVLVRTNGEIVYSVKPSYEGCFWSEAVTSSRSARFVVPSCNLSGRIRSIDAGGTDILKRIMLYDQPANAAPVALEVQGPALKGLARLALSPDGSRLAILNSEALELIQLPPVE